MSDTFTDNDLKTMHSNVAKQMKDNVEKKKHIGKSDFWNTTKAIIKIQKQLVAGYSFDPVVLETLIRAMFTFINGVVKPDAEAQGMEVVERG
jgi:hypothetical protein